MFSRGLMRSPQFGQCDGGETIDSPRGTRQMTTFRKLPKQAPRSAAYIDAIAVRTANLLLARVELAPGVLNETRRPEARLVVEDRWVVDDVALVVAGLDRARAVDVDRADDRAPAAGRHEDRLVVGVVRAQGRHRPVIGRRKPTVVQVQVIDHAEEGDTGAEPERASLPDDRSTKGRPTRTVDAALVADRRVPADRVVALELADDVAASVVLVAALDPNHGNLHLRACRARACREVAALVDRLLLQEHLLVGWEHTSAQGRHDRAGCSCDFPRLARVVVRTGERCDRSAAELHGGAARVDVGVVALLRERERPGDDRGAREADRDLLDLHQADDRARVAADDRSRANPDLVVEVGVVVDRALPVRIVRARRGYRAVVLEGRRPRRAQLGVDIREARGRAGGAGDICERRVVGALEATGGLTARDVGARLRTRPTLTGAGRAGRRQRQDEGLGVEDALCEVDGRFPLALLARLLILRVRQRERGQAD